MATNDKIGDYFVNSTGAWTNEITADEARELICNEDGNFITIEMTPTKYGCSKLEYCYGVDYVNTRMWNIPEEPVYDFILTNYNGDLICEYIVGKESKNVYILPNQGSMSAYQIQDNKKIKTYRYLGYKSYDWR